VKNKNGYPKRKEGMDERRKTERLEEQNDVTITVAAGEKNLPDEEINDSNTKNISVTGAKIQTHVFFPVDTVLDLDFISKTMNQKINVLGTVKWIKVIIDDKLYETGVEFFGTPNEAIKELGDFISLKQKSTKD